MMINLKLVVCIAALALLAGCANTTFIISKNDRAYYLGTKSRVLDAMLCKSGDLQQILKEVSIPDHLKKEFYRYNCTDEQSKEKIVAIYTFFTPEEKEELKSAFRRHGYDINYVPC
ncbi:MAG TPA: hypothetical protein VMB78_10370 [Dissulfurispiraceae bacterium]|nr:hypothetical protein [Dissulfurispiraceae bacterium]